MGCKTHEIKGEVSSPKQKVSKAFRSINGLGKEDPDVCSPCPSFTFTSYEPSNSLKNTYSLEVESKKAEPLMYARRFLDRPR